MKYQNKTRHYIIFLSIVAIIYQLIVPHHVFAAEINYWQLATSSKTTLVFTTNKPLPTGPIIYYRQFINLDNIKTSSNNETNNITEENSADNLLIVKKLTPQEEMRAWVLSEIEKAGLNPKEADNIINCESRWNDKAVNYNRNGSNDKGLWQINSIHKEISDAEKLDYKSATKWAIKKRLDDGNWSAWYCAKILAIK